MKKTSIFSLAALALFGAASCGNVEVEVYTLGQTQTHPNAVVVDVKDAVVKDVVWSQDGKVMGQMVKEFEDWCMEPHEYGDYDIIKTKFGYHLMFYIEGEELWHQVANSAVLSQKMGELLEAEEAKTPLVVDCSKIVLGDAKLN